MSEYKFLWVNHAEGKEEAIAEIEARGYPRVLSDEEKEESLFIRIEGAAIGWLQPMSGEGNLLLHVFVFPEHRSKLLKDIHVREGFYAICELLNARRVFIMPPKEAPGIGRLARAFGWKRYDRCYVWEVRP